MKKLIVALFLVATPALSQDAQQQMRAIPALVDQRNVALNAVAVCLGDTQELQSRLSAANKEIAALRAALASAGATWDR